MKVLHIGDKASVACILAKNLRNIGIDSRVFKMGKFNPSDSLQYYKEAAYYGSQFHKEAIKLSKNYDIIHLHGNLQLIGALKEMDKKVVLHHHGGDFYNNEHRAGDCLKADKILCSTKDMLPDLFKRYGRGEWLPNCPDQDLFRPNKDFRRREGLFITQDSIDASASFRLIRQHTNIDFEIINRNINMTLYKDMPELLNQYSHYLHFKQLPRDEGTVKDRFSKTSLEALACGLIVLTPFGEVTELPIEHTEGAATKRIIEIYKSL